jgi:ribulose-phosphate 3-epimerase
MEISASLLAAPWGRLTESAQQMIDAGVDRLHVDVMDHHYVPNLSFGPALVAALRADGIKIPIDLHLMVTPIEPILETCLSVGAQTIYFHPQSASNVKATLQKIQQAGCGAGLAITQVDNIQDMPLKWVDHWLLMTVTPGFAGQRILNNAHQWVAEQLVWMHQYHRTGSVAVDGAINVNNAPDFFKIGINQLVMGSGLFQHPSPKTVIKKIQIKEIA